MAVSGASLPDLTGGLADVLLLGFVRGGRASWAVRREVEVVLRSPGENKLGGSLRELFLQHDLVPAISALVGAVVPLGRDPHREGVEEFWAKA